MCLTWKSAGYSLLQLLVLCGYPLNPLQTAAFVPQPAELREGFLADLNPESPGFPHTLGELADKLKSWRNRLQTELEAAMPASLRLEEECRALQVSC